MNKVIQIIEALSEYSGRYVSYLIIPLILTIVYSVTTRYFFNSVVHWSFEMTLFMFGIMVMIGGAYTLKHQSHVRVDVLPAYLGHRWKCYLDIFSFLVVIAVCCVITYLSTRTAWVSTLRLERSSLQTPFDPQIWWFKWMIPISTTLIGLQAIVEIVKTVRTLNSDPEESS
jgi:TRAP-type mannitol/chloroaromatic compound transport system permease small subunit